MACDYGEKRSGSGIKGSAVRVSASNGRHCHLKLTAGQRNCAALVRIMPYDFKMKLLLAGLLGALSFAPLAHADVTDPTCANVYLATVVQGQDTTIVPVLLMQDWRRFDQAVAPKERPIEPVLASNIFYYEMVVDYLCKQNAGQSFSDVAADVYTAARAKLHD